MKKYIILFNLVLFSGLILNLCGDEDPFEGQLTTDTTTTYIYKTNTTVTTTTTIFTTTTVIPPDCSSGFSEQLLTEVRFAYSSPDNYFILFCDSSSNLYTINHDLSNSNQIASNVITAFWSPNNFDIAYFSGTAGSYSLYLTDRDGSRNELLVSNITSDEPKAFFSTTSQLIYYYENFDGYYFDLSYFSRDDDTTKFVAEGLRMAKYSRYGNFFLCLDEMDILYILPAAGGMPSTISDSVVEADWSYENDKIIYYIGEYSIYSLYIVGISGQGFHLVDSYLDSLNAFLSRDGTKLYYSNNFNPSNNTFDLYVQSASGTTKILTEIKNVTLSPDGQSLFFCSVNDEWFIANYKGDNPALIDSTIVYHKWSDNSEKLFYVKSKSSPFTLMKYDIASKSVNQIDSELSSPSINISQDNTKVFFWKNYDSVSKTGDFWSYCIE